MLTSLNISKVSLLGFTYVSTQLFCYIDNTKPYSNTYMMNEERQGKAIILIPLLNCLPKQQ